MQEATVYESSLTVSAAAANVTDCECNMQAVCLLQVLLAPDMAFPVFDALMHVDKLGSPAPLILEHSLHHLLASASSQT